MDGDGVHVVVQCPFSVALLDIEMSSAILKGHWLTKQRPTPPFTVITLNLHGAMRVSLNSITYVCECVFEKVSHNVKKQNQKKKQPTPSSLLICTILKA